jgi:eukaryotic-like serine/threonine-protein kinase
LLPSDPGEVMPPKPLETGDPRSLGRFELLARLGEGGQGVVYLGRGAGPGEERVAVKVLRSTVDASILQRLARELDAVHKVQPFVTARVIEASTEGERRYIVSEFIDGPSLEERVDERGPLPEGELHRLAVGTATALTAIHGAGVMHRDFKPANVLLGPDGPRVVDFGIARLITATTMTSGLIGTPAYIAPEQLAGGRPTSAVDIFAWAVTMIFAATGRRAFDGDTVVAVMHRIVNDQPDVSGVPPSLLPVIRDCLSKDPSNRPSARDLLLRLVDPSLVDRPRAAAEPGVSPTAPTVQRPAVRPARDDTADTGPISHEDLADRTDPVPALSGATDPKLEASWLAPPGPAATRSRRGPVLAAGGAAAVVALIVVGVLLLTRGSTPGTGGGVGTFSASLASTSTASASTTPTGQPTGPTIPSQFAGTWSGTATMFAVAEPSFGLQNNITFMMADGGRTAEETNDTCTNTLTLAKVTATVLTFHEPQNDLCVAGIVTFTLQGGDLAYVWTDGIEKNTATLHRNK